MSDRQNDRFARSSECLSSSLTTTCTRLELFRRKFFENEYIFKLGIQKNFHCPLSKISLHYQTVIDQRLGILHQMFSWTSVGSLKCPIDKTSASQGHLTV